MPARPNYQRNIRNVALIGSYVPRQCGIATFTKDLRDGIAGVGGAQKTLVLAMDDASETYRYPQEVAFQIPKYKNQEYFTSADLININQVDVVIVQHEYGIYGGADGEFVLDLVKNLRMPIITTLHTVLQEPSPGQAKVLRELGKHSDRLVVMSHLAATWLRDVYSIPEEKICFIPHGIHDVPFVEPAVYKDEFGLEGQTVMLTFGLLGPSKGIEVAIRALPKIVEQNPDLVYVVLGATHPEILKREGSAYRIALERMAKSLGVRDHVQFHNRFVTLEELCGYIGAADIYVTPYPNKAQITSGTLAYALGAGKVIVSTPYWYAEELLAQERGRLFPFGDHEVLAATVNELLRNDAQRNAMRNRAYLHGRSMVWSEVARDYLALAEKVILEHQFRPRFSATFRRQRADAESIPDVNLFHMQTLTDGTGILQHATCAVPDRHHGYCVDDNARALIVAVMSNYVYKDGPAAQLANTYLSFLHYAFDTATRRFHNFMSYDRRWLDEMGSEDSHSRAIWALGVSTALAPNEGILAFSTRLFSEALPSLQSFSSPRAWAFALIGIHAYLKRFDGDTTARRMRVELSERLFGLFERQGAPEWPWCEDCVTYDNAKLPHALILSGQWIPNKEMVQQGLRSLEWLVMQQLHANGRVSLIGNAGWLSRTGDRASFDQQPVEAMALVEACAEAYRCTQDPVWLNRTRQCFGWFLGNNDSQTVLYDYQTGGCHDGLQPNGPNANEGAESTVAWLISLLTMNDLARPALDANLSLNARVAPAPTESLI